jgi:ankyrin repeat protein
MIKRSILCEATVESPAWLSIQSQIAAHLATKKSKKKIFIFLLLATNHRELTGRMNDQSQRMHDNEDGTDSSTINTSLGNRLFEVIREKDIGQLVEWIHSLREEVRQDLCQTPSIGFKALELACQLRDKGMVDLLTEGLRFDVNAVVTNNTLLMQALLDADFDFAAFLINSGADVDVKIDGTPILHLCCLRGLDQQACFLLDHGADINAFDNVSMFRHKVYLLFLQY